MRRLVPAVVLVLALLSAGTASATTLAFRFPAFVTELQSRLSLIPATHLTKLEKKQKAALNRAITALLFDTGDLGKSIGNAKKAIGAADGAFPADATLDPLENAVVDGLANDTGVRNGALVRSILTLAPGTPQTKAQAKSDSAGANLAASSTATPHVARLKLIASAVAAIAAGEKIVKKAGGTIGGDITITALDVDINTTAAHLHVPGTTPPVGTYLVVYETTIDRVMVTAQGMVDGKSHAFTIAVPGHGTGTRDVPIIGPSMYSSPGVTPPPAQVTKGSMTFTTWDQDNHKIAGTFDVTFSNGTSAIHLMNGVFSSLDFKVP